MKKELTHQLLLEKLSYDPISGVFARKLPFNHKRSANGGIGRVKENGYFYIGLNGKEYFSHRLAWFYVYGKWPDGQIDHINGDKLDNRIVNLRNVSQNINMQNYRKPQSRNKTGFLGVTVRNNKYSAQLTLNGKPIRIGSFKTPESAHEAYLKAKRMLHEGCTI